MKKTYEFTEAQEGLLRIALSYAIENDETFFTDGLTRDPQQAADYRGFLVLQKMLGGTQ
jgi:hypothetical protein